MKEAVDDIMVTLNEAASEVGLVGGMVDAIAEAMSKVRLKLAPRTPATMSSSLSHTIPNMLFSGKLIVKAETSKPSFPQGVANEHMASHISNILFFLHY